MSDQADPEQEQEAIFRVIVPVYGRAAHVAAVGGRVAREMQLRFGSTTVVTDMAGNVIEPIEE